MPEEKAKQIAEKGEKIYFEIAEVLRKKYPAGYYVAIEPKTGRFFVGKDTLEAAKKARKEFPRRTFFGAHVGYLNGRI